MTKAIAITALLASVLIAVGCSQGSSDGSGGGAVPEKVTKAATIANEIESSPDQAAEILQRHGMTTEEWTALMYEIAENDAWSAAFEAARKR